ncbi:MAG: hypothetical protein ACJ8F7_09445 [Gemmataceae bacterium]
MKANEAVRFRCGDCRIVFDLCVDGLRDTEAAEAPPVVEFGEPTTCPFCGAGELTPAHEPAVRVAAGPSR